MKYYTYKDLIVWQKSMDLVVLIYKVTDQFPKSEIYGMSAQMRRSSISIPPNIAEGRRRNSSKEFKHFLFYSIASGAELETQIELSRRLNFIKEYDFEVIYSLLQEIMKMLNTLITKI